MRLYVARPAKSSKVAWVKSPRMHIKRTPRALLYWAYMVHLGGYRCPTRLLAVLANGVHSKVGSPQATPAP